MATIFNPGVSSNFYDEVRKGNVPGHISFITIASHPAMPTTLSTIWEEGGIYVFPPTAGSMTISSDSANDTAAGTGARIIAFFGLDDNWDPLALDSKGFPSFTLVTLNGTSGVALPSDLFRINAMAVGNAGSLTTNAGNIYIGTGAITAGKPATVFEKIVSGVGLSQTGKFSVPNGFNYLNKDIVTFVETNKTFTFFVNSFLNSTGVTFNAGPLPGLVGTQELDDSRPGLRPGQQDVKYEGNVLISTGVVFLADAGILIKTECLNLTASSNIMNI